MPPHPDLLTLASMHRLHIRRPSSPDWPELQGIGQHSFATPAGWERNDRVLRRVVEDGPYVSPHGEWRTFVATSAIDLRPVGYVCYQLRHDGDVHIAELAALPPPPRTHFRYTGTLLLGAALEDGIAAGYSKQTTLNVTRWDAIDDEIGSAPLPAAARFYIRYGYRVQEHAEGYMPEGGHRPDGDLWMMADASLALDTIGTYLACGAATSARSRS